MHKKIFERAHRAALNSNEEWGENAHGYFSFESGTFIPKSEGDEMMGRPEVSVSWPGESTEKKEE